MGIDNLDAVILEAKKNKYSSISSLSEDDMFSIWETASHFIRNQMLQNKGVTIPGLGTFTFSQIKLNVGKIVIQRPIFVFSEWFLQTHNLVYSKQHASGHIPVIPLNYSTLSKQTLFSRDLVEMCFKEILLAMSRCLNARRNIQLDFNRVGRLLICDTKAKMKFFHDFIKKLDVSGELENAFRTHTTQSEMSIMTNPIPSRLSTASALTLPSIIESPSSEVVDPSHHSVNADSSTIEKSIQCEDHDVVKELADQKESDLDNQKQSINSRQLIPKPASLVSSRDRHKSDDSHASPHTIENGERRCQSVSEHIQPACSHDSIAGQELCYLCHQRDKRNVYVDVSKKKREREQQYEKILHEYQQKKYQLTKAKELDAKKVHEWYTKDVTAYNLELAGKKKQLKVAMKSDEFYPTYIFQQRTNTPDKLLRQMEYSSQLESQINRVQEHLKEVRDKKEKMERDEQNELAKRLAEFKKACRIEKAEQVAEYRKALAEQVHEKSGHRYEEKAEASKTENKHPIFGVLTAEEDVVARSKEKKNLLMEGLAVIADKQRRAKEKAMKKRQEEAEMLRRTKEELIQDVQEAGRRRLADRKKLEESWNISINDKNRQLLNELQHSKKKDILLLQQCDKYKRCHRCQRRRDNQGETNLYPHNYFSSGSRLMV